MYLRKVLTKVILKVTSCTFRQDSVDIKIMLFDYFLLVEKSVYNFIPCTINVQGSPLDEQIVWHTVVCERFHNSQIENDINYRHVFV